MQSGIYSITVLRRGKPPLIYIGQAAKFHNRKSSHFASLRRGDHSNWRLQALFIKYGEASFFFTRLLVCRPVDLPMYEQAILDLNIKSCGRRILNINRQCATSSLGVCRSEESRRRMSDAKKGKPGRIWSEESKNKVSLANAGRKPSSTAIAGVIARCTGSRASPETRHKMSLSQQGRTMSLEAREKIRSSKINLSESARSKLSAAAKGNQHCLGRRASPETREKMRTSAIAREQRKRILLTPSVPTNSVDHEVVQVDRTS